MTFETALAWSVIVTAVIPAAVVAVAALIVAVGVWKARRK